MSGANGGRPGSLNDAECNGTSAMARTCIFIQIDGLSYSRFEEALAKGRLPFLKSLIDEKSVVARPWRAMIPTSTSAFQSGFFYGDNEDIPGFFWYDRGKGRKVRMDGVHDTARTEARIRERVQPFKGLLAGGSSYSALFTGGAENTFLTFAKLFRPRLGIPLKGTWFFFFLYTQALLILRLAWYSAVELLLAVYDLIRGLFTGKNRLLEFKFVIPRIISVVWCREIAALAAMYDICRGHGPIYLNNFAWDEHAHHRGPSSRFAFWTLKGIDGAIRRIWRTARRAGERGIARYDIFVWSDHGQADSIPFHEQTGQEPGRHFNLLFQKYYGETGAIREKAARLLAPERRTRGRPARGQRGRQAAELSERQIEHARQLQDFVPPFLRRCYLRLLPGCAERNVSGAGNTHAVHLVSTGPVAHLYLAGHDTPVPYEVWREHYPRFLDDLARHPGAGFVLIRRKDGGVMAGLDGIWIDLADPAAIEKLPPSFRRDLIAQHRDALRRWARMPSAGDILIFGQREAGEKIISYSYEWGGHAGISPEETTPFIVVPAACAADWPELEDQNPDTITLPILHEKIRAMCYAKDRASGG
jgi:hypothetical protein